MAKLEGPKEGRRERRRKKRWKRGDHLEVAGKRERSTFREERLGTYSATAENGENRTGEGESDRKKGGRRAL